MKAKQDLYNEISKTLTNFECGKDKVNELYSLLVKVQNNWDGVITCQDKSEHTDSNKVIFTLLYQKETDGEYVHYTGTAGEIRNLMKQKVIYPADCILVKGTVVCLTNNLIIDKEK